MFAVIQTGGKQYKVASSETLVVEKLEGSPGDTVSLDVVAVGDEKRVAVGTPLVNGAKVSAEILSHGQGDKVIIFKKKRRQNYRRTRGHRQPYTALFITEIVDDQGNKSAADANKKPKQKTAPAAEKKPAVKKEAKKAAPAKPAAAKKEAAPKKPAADKPAAQKSAAKPAAEKKAASAKKPAAEKKPAAAKKPAAKKTESKAKK